MDADVKQVREDVHEDDPDTEVSTGWFAHVVAWAIVAIVILSIFSGE